MPTSRLSLFELIFQLCCASNAYHVDGAGWRRNFGTPLYKGTSVQSDFQYRHVPYEAQRAHCMTATENITF